MAGDPLLRIEPFLSRGGRRGRRAAVLLDTARLVGPRPFWRAARRPRLSVLGEGARGAVYRRIWQGAADAIGAELEDLGRGFVQVRRGGRVERIFQQITTIDDPVTVRMALDKPFSHRLLALAEVRVPEQAEFTPDDPSTALELLERVDCCVVKPARGTGGGEGVFAGIRGADDLQRARMRAAGFDDVLVAERQAPGPLHRLLLLEGELLDVVVDRPPQVVGDGRSTVEELIDAENRRRVDARGEAGLELLKLDLDTALTLRRSGLGALAVPAAGREVPVKSITNDRRLEDSHTYRGAVHPDVLDQAVAGARAIGLRLAGVDVVAPCIDRPLAETHGAVIEVNGTPGIHRHYHVADRRGATPVADRLLEHLLG